MKIWAASTKTPAGKFNWAAVAGPPSPVNPAVPSHGGYNPCGYIHPSDAFVARIGYKYIPRLVGVQPGRKTDCCGGTLSTISSKIVDAVPCDGKDDPCDGIYSTNPLTENIRNKKITG